MLAATYHVYTSKFNICIRCHRVLYGVFEICIVSLLSLLSFYIVVPTTYSYNNQED